MAPVRVALVDDHALLRQALASLLRSRPEVEVVGEFDNGRDAAEGLCALSPDVVLMDIALPRLSGIDVARRVRRDCKSVRVIMLSATVDAEQLREALRAGASGYLIKRSEVAELILAIQSVSLGNTFFSAEITRSFDLDEIWRQALAPAPASGVAALTDREREILHLLVEGATVPVIARELVLSPKTVEGHKTRLMAKLGARNRTELIRLALRMEPPAEPHDDAARAAG